MNQPNEVERLRARVAELEAELAVESRPPSRGRAGGRSWWRSLSSGILITLACVLAALSVVSVWASTQVSDTERYVETVAPLADDPAVQRAIADDVTRAIFENLDIETLTTEALQALAQRENVPPRVGEALPALAAPISDGVENFTRSQVNRIVASPQFAAAWEEVNRIAHEQIVNLLQGTQGGVVSAQGDTITLNLGPIIELVKERLVAQGFDLANRIPTIERSFVLVQSEAITDAQALYRLLDTLGTWLPFVALGIFAVGVYLARDRRRALLQGALGVAGAMVALGVGLAVLRVLYLDAVPADVLPEAAAGNVFDTMVRFLRTGLRTTAVLGLVVALAAFMTGPSAAALRTRATLTHGIGWVRGGAETAGWRTGPFGSWVYAHKRALRIATVIAWGLVLMFWERPTGWVVVGSALAVVLVLGLIEFLARPPAPPEGPARTPTSEAMRTDAHQPTAGSPGTGEVPR
ncbi:MAG TPA: hypothetical protein VFZ32_10675 [Micromonosporaceae bacterium]